VVLYVRVVKKGGGLTKDARRSPTISSRSSPATPLPAPGKPVELTRRIVVTPATSRLLLAQPAAGPEPKKNDVLVKGVVKKIDLTVPNLWAAEFTTSTLLLIDKIEPLKESPTQETIVFKPYTFTGADMVLARDNDFKKTEELTLYFHVYNPVFENKRPDVTIEYES